MVRFCCCHVCVFVFVTIVYNDFVDSDDGKGKGMIVPFSPHRGSMAVNDI